VLPIISQWDSYEKLHFMEYEAPLYFLRFLFVRGSTTILLVGGLGVEEQHNGPIKRPYSMRFILWDWVKEEASQSN
jgi:hypothetical protein